MSPGQFRALPERERAEILAYERLVCSKCGNLRSVCSDPERDWHPQTSVCWPTATVEWGVRRLNDKHGQPDSDSTELHPLDGVSVWASPEDLGDPEFDD